MVTLRRRNQTKYCSALASLNKATLGFVVTIIISIVAIIGFTTQLINIKKGNFLSNKVNESLPCETKSQSHNAIQPYERHSHDNKNTISSTFKSSAASSDNIAIFYNVFIADDKTEMLATEKAAPVEQVLSIIKEQLESRSASIYPEAPLYYLSSGKDIGGIPNCTNCEQLDHKSIGNEVLTLSKIHEFCSENPNKTVAYIHNKGSFHPSKQNDLLRRMLTKAVFSKECLLLKNPTTRRSTNSPSDCKCNVCSARFSPLPHFHTPGNMWVGSCAYISKLIHPKMFGKEMDKAAECAPTSRFGKVTKIAGTHIGRGRFSSEHWVHSHPDVCPCDVYPGTYLWAYERLPLNDNWQTDLVHAPRFPMIEDFEEEEYFLSLRKTAQGAWFSLVGRIHEWKAVYGKIPDEKSWVWDYYSASYAYGEKE